MTTIVQRVLERLEARARASTTITLYDEAIYSDSILLNAATITIQGVDYGHLQTLRNGIRVPWVRFLDQAITYDCHITLKLSVMPTRLLSHSMIYQWPIIIRDKLGRRLYAFQENWIPAGPIRSCEKGALIVVKPYQRLTMAAKEACEKLNIGVIEGSE